MSPVAASSLERKKIKRERDAVEMFEMCCCVVVRKCGSDGARRSDWCVDLRKPPFHPAASSHLDDAAVDFITVKDLLIFSAQPKKHSLRSQTILRHNCSFLLIPRMPENVEMSHNGCPKCGAAINGGGKKCGSCGAVRLRDRPETPVMLISNSPARNEANRTPVGAEGADNDAGTPQSTVSPYFENTTNAT